MGWCNEDGKHEGWGASLFADGAISGGSSSEGLTVTQLGDGTELEYDDWQTRPGAEVIGWVPVCSCGWRGEVILRVATPERHDPAGRAVYTDDQQWAELDDALQSSLVHPEWTAHVRPFDVVADVEQAAQRYADAGRELTEVVARARSAGASWADIGRAAGMSRQSAHERWARVAG